MIQSRFKVKVIQIRLTSGQLSIVDINFYSHHHDNITKEESIFVSEYHGEITNCLSIAQVVFVNNVIIFLSTTAFENLSLFSEDVAQ